MLRPLIVLVIALIPFGTVAAQSVPVVDVSVSLLNWTQHLNTDLDKYFTQDKGEELARNVEALQRELTLYMKARKTLSDSIYRNNVATGNKDPKSLELLRTHMGEIIRQMRNVTDLTNNELRAEGDRLNDKIYNVLNSEGTYLSYLDAFLTGKDVTKKEMALEGGVAYNRLQQSAGLLGSLHDKIRRKMK